MISPLTSVKLINFTSNNKKSDKIEPKNQLTGTKTTKTTKTIVPNGPVYGTKINKIDLSMPLNQLCYHATGAKGAKYDKWTEEHLICGQNRPDKKWVFARPQEVLNRSLEEAINSNLSLVYGEKIPKEFPKDILTPNYGDNWGRHANYIEINNRAIADMHGDRTNGSILNTIKFLPLIPPSHDKWANCILISQLYPNIWGDGWNNNGENSLYGIKLKNKRFSDNIGRMKIGNKTFTPEEQIKIFNDIAHLRGFKTSFRMLISEDQLKIGDAGQFRWNNPTHVKTFIEACCKGIKNGFDGIFFDSAKHIGGYDWENYAGVGAVPNYGQMAYILDEIRKCTERFDLSFSGEKIENDTNRYKGMGFNAGTSFLNANDINAVKNSSEQQKYCKEFAWGPVVSDDNDIGVMSYEERLKRIISSLFGYNNAYDKLPSFMQMHDLFPLNYYTNTHKLMLANTNFSSDNTPSTHYNNLFADSDIEKRYTDNVMKEFMYSYNYGN